VIKLSSALASLMLLFLTDNNPIQACVRDRFDMSQAVPPAQLHFGSSMHSRAKNVEKSRFSVRTHSFVRFGVPKENIFSVLSVCVPDIG
jgi:hypothetical protein